MIIEIRLDEPTIRRWHVALAEELATRPGIAVRMTGEDAPPVPAAEALLLSLEGLVYGRPGDDPLAPASLPAAISAPMDAVADLVLDLSGLGPGHGGSAPAKAPWIVIAIAGLPARRGAIAAILAGDAPVLQAWQAVSGGEARDPQLLATWRLAVEEPDVVCRAITTVIGRVVELALAAASGLLAAPSDGSQPMLDVAHRSSAGVPSHFLHLGLGLMGRIRGRLDRLARRAPRWATAIRARKPPVSNGLPDLTGPFHRLADDGARFFADPFLIEEAGRRWLFVEELPYATGKGVISVAEIGADGAPSPTRVVLETGCHLSYPFLLHHDGAVHMIPETSGRRTVELWRAVAFPDRWEQVATLIEGVDLGDATIIERGGTLFLLAARRERWTSSWDSLDLWMAPALTGPWRRVGALPQRVDAAGSRPAGAVFSVGGRLVRPVQDCVSGYGAGLAFTEIEGLSGDGITERVIARHRPSAPLRGLHTYNRSASLEAIDVFAPGDAAVTL